MNIQSMRKHVRSTQWQKIAPWLCSGASTVYAVARARQLSRSEASTDPLLRFLVQQSDVVMVLCGSTAVWYAVVRRRAAYDNTPTQPSVVDPQLVRQLRQVLSALLLGIGLLERRIEQGAYAQLGALAKRLHAVVRQGAIVLDQIEQSPVVVAAITARSSLDEPQT